MTTKTYTLNQIRVLANSWEQQLCKAILEDAPIEQITEMSKTADLWRGRLIVAEDECTRLNKIEWTFEVQDTPTTVQYAGVALCVVLAVCLLPLVVEAIVWLASVWGL